MLVFICIVQSDIEHTIRSKISGDLKDGMLAAGQLVHVCVWGMEGGGRD